jgi:Zn-dependent metalloprotease
MNITIEQAFTFLAFLFPTIIGLLNWYDRRKPRMLLTPVEEGDLSVSLNKAIALANKRALDAEERASKLEVLYESMKTEFDVWMSNQNYRLVFNVTLGKNPHIENTEIIYTSGQTETKTPP